MKKIIILFILIFSLTPSISLREGWDGLFITSYAGCTYTEGAELSTFLNGCKPGTVVGASDMKVDGGFKTKINTWIKNISLILGVLAVGALVYAGLIMQLSAGEDEKIKKGKNIIQWTIIGFLLLISASGIVYIVINVMFGLGGTT